MFKMTLNNLVVFAGPLAIWSLVAGSIIKEQKSNRLREVGVYVLLQLTCAILHTFVVLPLLHSEYSYSTAIHSSWNIKKHISSAREFCRDIDEWY